jgi:predicted nucleic acid-binding protein
MNALFADTYYFIALLNAKDPTHSRAVELSRKRRGRLVSTAWVFTELADGLARTADRYLFATILADFESDPVNLFIGPEEEVWRRGIDLYYARQDKEWSLTDCISFIVMQDHGITDALTGDHHFEQAGFNALLK